MKNTRTLLLLSPLVLACLTACPAWALEPCRASNVYIEGVDRIIDRAVGRSPELALTVLPSFEAEYGVRMIGADVYLVQLRRSFWARSVVADGPRSYHHDFRHVRVGTSIHQTSLSPEVAARVRQHYARAISAAKQSVPVGLDGTTYRFVVKATGCGETWSPQAKSANGQLVALAELLAGHARRGSSLSRRQSEEKILRAIAGGQYGASYRSERFVKWRNCRFASIPNGR
ncbi:MAG: hypothetical protein ACJ8HI_08305 [Massilia sp.]